MKARNKVQLGLDVPVQEQDSSSPVLVSKNISKKSNCLLDIVW